LANGESINALTGLYNNFFIDATTPPGSYFLTVDGALTNGNYIVSKTVSNLWRVYKATGENVSGAPTVNGTPASTNITVNAVSLPKNPGNQTVEYALATSGSITGWELDALTWQSDTTFTGYFPEGGAYYVYARSAENEYFASGNAQVGEAFTIDIITGIDPPLQINMLKAWIQNGTLRVSGLTVGKTWSVYNLAGMLLYQGIATDNAETQNITSLQKSGVYVLRSDGRVVKVAAY
jgi:hypothetical protein